MSVTGRLRVVEMRAFRGPEVPWILDPRPLFVQRWYVKAILEQDPTFRGRWIVERRSADVAGISAVAPFRTRGFRSPDWRAFEGQGDPRSIPGLPGRWSGLVYDYVTGEDGPGFPGLPKEVVGCLAGT
jgi:hypothetical protein